MWRFLHFQLHTINNDVLHSSDSQWCIQTNLLNMDKNKKKETGHVPLFEKEARNNLVLFLSLFCLEDAVFLFFSIHLFPSKSANSKISATEFITLLVCDVFTLLPLKSGLMLYPCNSGIFLTKGLYDTHFTVITDNSFKTFFCYQ